MAGKGAQAFRTIGELAGELGVPQHILRYWETRFPQLRPLQRAGNRRYYRPDDVALAHRIHRLLNEQGYTIRGVQRVLAEGTGEENRTETIRPPGPLVTPEPRVMPGPPPAPQRDMVPIDRLRALRTLLADALAEAAR